jgi:LPS sulfotransferase NodH
MSNYLPVGTQSKYTKIHMKNTFGNNRFVIVTTARTGSNLLVRTINRAPKITCYGEIMKQEFRQESSAEQFFLQLSEILGLSVQYLEKLQVNNPSEFLNLIFDSKNAGILGFKLFYRHAREDVRKTIWQGLQEHQEIKIIHLLRRNLLDTYMSLQYAHLTDQWILPTFAYKEKIESLDRYDREMLSINPRVLLNFFEITSKYIQETKTMFAHHKYLELYYENLDSQYDREIEKAFNFLEVPLIIKEQPTIKQRSKTNRERIKNYQELLGFFKNTDWIGFFSESDITQRHPLEES